MNIVRQQCLIYLQSLCLTLLSHSTFFAIHDENILKCSNKPSFFFKMKKAVCQNENSNVCV